MIIVKQQTNRLYTTIRQRYKRKKSRIFLHRNLRRNVGSNSRDDRYMVLYQSNEPGVYWSSQISDLRCLWCRECFFPFHDRLELLQHLRNCHGSLSYSLLPVTNLGILPIKIRLQRGIEAAVSTSVDRFTAHSMEETLTNKKNRKRSRSRSGSIECEEISLQNMENEQKRMKQSKDRNPNTDDQKGKGKNGSEKGRAAFKSIQHAVRKNMLFHSFVQTPLSLEEFCDGVDSDADPSEEQEWRLGMKADEVNEYVDTISVEKLFMNLWNQFIRMEFVAYADKTIAPACVAFVKSKFVQNVFLCVYEYNIDMISNQLVWNEIEYGCTLRRLNLEVTFLRHLTEMTRIGLIDSDNVFKVLEILGKVEPDSAKEKDTKRLLFAEQIAAEASADERRQEMRRRRQVQNDEEK